MSKPMSQVKLRSEIDSQWKWDLSHIYESDAAWEKDFVKVKELCRAFASYQGKVAENPIAPIKARTEAELLLTSLYSYARMHLDEDNANSTYQAFSDRAMSLYVEAETSFAFLDPELLTLPEETLQALAGNPEMKDYDAFMHRLLRGKPHTLPAEQERLLAMTGEIAATPDTIYTMLTSVDMKFPEIEDADGNKVELTEASFGIYRQSPNRKVREASFNALFGTYRSFASTLAASYSGSVKVDLFSATAHCFDSAVEASLFRDEIPLAVYENLIAAVHDSIPVLNEYLTLIQKALKVDQLHMYDMYASTAPNFSMPLTYTQAYDLVLEGLAPLGEDYLSVLRDARIGGWIDVYPSKAKSNGAYSWGSYSNKHPYVLLNHQDDLDSAMTIAHEMGHAMHSYYSNANQPAPKSSYSLFLAEVASTCNEVLLITYLMEKHKDDKTALLFLCNNLLEQFRTTVFRQTMFAEFELISHRMAEEGEALTHEALTNVYYELNKTYYGGVCHVDEAIGIEWARIPHFYRAFYVYQYATGFSAAVALANRILTEGAPAVADYRKFLSAGSSLSPIETLKLAGVDMLKPETVTDAMKLFKKTVEKLGSLM